MYCRLDHAVPAWDNYFINQEIIGCFFIQKNRRQIWLRLNVLYAELISLKEQKNVLYAESALNVLSLWEW